jgi:SAM-dependent methyltransferase
MNVFDLQPDFIALRYTRGTASAMQLSAIALTERDRVIQKIHVGAYVFGARPCAVCSGRSFRILAERDRYGLPIQTTICPECGLIQTTPDMREEDYRDFYTHHYRKLYINDLVGDPAGFFQEEYWRGQRILRYVRKSIDLPAGALVLEVGCGAGGILHAFATQGYRVIGTDLGVENLEYGREQGLDLRVGDVFELKLPERPALIIYSHVLEHIRDPERTLQRVHELLDDSGRLYIEVPGVKDVRHNVFQGDFLQTFHIAHIYNFSRRSLCNLMTKNGFCCIQGDESIRAVFRPCEKHSSEFQSDYASAMSYIKTTERWRGYYRARFRVKSRVSTLIDSIRSSSIDMLHRVGLYASVKRLTGH